MRDYLVVAYADSDSKERLAYALRGIAQEILEQASAIEDGRIPAVVDMSGRVFAHHDNRPESVEYGDSVGRVSFQPHAG